MGKVETGNGSVFTARQKRLGCTVLFFVWFVLTTILTVAKWSVFPIVTDAFDLTGGWVTGGLIATGLVAFFLSGLIALTLMIFGLAFGSLVILIWHYAMRKEN